MRTAFCTKDSLLWTTPTTPERALPLDLLNSLTIDNSKYGVNRFGWQNAYDRLSELSTCPAALDAVTNLNIDIWVHDTKWDTVKESTLPQPALYPLFADVLSRMPHLDMLDWTVRPEARPGFEAAFTAAKISLPNVTQLVLAGEDEWLVRQFPQLSHLTLKRISNTSMIHSTSSLNLSSFSARSSTWRVSWETILEALLETQPGIAAIHMDGELYHGANWKDNQTAFTQHLDLLARFENLTTLTLPYAFDLGLGFDGGPGCGNAYDGAGGHAYGRQVVRERVEVTERAAREVLKKIPGLKQLGIGSGLRNVTVNEDGEAEVTWPWTRRLKEYTYDMWPKVGDELEDGDEYVVR